MNIGEHVKKSLKEKDITITKAANIAGCTRQAFYNKIKTGNFFYCELMKLQNAKMIDVLKL